MAIYDNTIPVRCGNCNGYLFHKRPTYRVDMVDGKLKELELYTSLICNNCGSVVIKELEED